MNARFSSYMEERDRVRRVRADLQYPNRLIRGSGDSPKGIIAVTTVILSGEKQCRGPCKRRLAPEAFRRSGKSADGREATCRDCRAARSPKRQGVELAERVEAMRAEYLSHRRIWGDPEHERAKAELSEWVRRNGQVRLEGVEYAWDVLESEMFRRVVRR